MIRALPLALLAAALAGCGAGEPEDARVDRLLLAAYTAYLHHAGRTESLGIPEEGLIVIPRANTIPTPP